MTSPTLPISAASIHDQTDSWQGRLDLQFVQRQNQTIPAHSTATAPLKVQRPFYAPDGTCQMTIVHTAGGMVSGDQLDLQIKAEADATALVTTPAAHKVYRSTGAKAQQNIHLQIAPGACLEWFPQETIIFNGAQFQQTLQVELAPGALWLGWDMTRFGRTARGETFLSGHWQSRTEVWQQGNPLWIDRQWLTGGSDVLNSPHGLSGHPVIASFAMVGMDISPKGLAELHRVALNTETQNMNHTDLNADRGITQLQSGLLCRYRGGSTQQARRWFMAIWQSLKPQITGNVAHVPRVWGTAL